MSRSRILDDAHRHHAIVEARVHGDQVEQWQARLCRPPQRDVIGVTRLAAAVLVRDQTGVDVALVVRRWVDGRLNAERGAFPTEDAGPEEGLLVFRSGTRGPCGSMPSVRFARGTRLP